MKGFWSTERQHPKSLQVYQCFNTFSLENAGQFLLFDRNNYLPLWKRFLAAKSYIVGKFLNIKKITGKLGVGTCSATYHHVKNHKFYVQCHPYTPTTVQCTFRSLLNKQEYAIGINALHVFNRDQQREGCICDKWWKTFVFCWALRIAAAIQKQLLLNNALQ